MPENNNSFRNIVKSTTVVGGAQVIQMVITILRAKIVAVLLGSAGMGIIALIQSAIFTIQQFTNFGIFQSGVRELSQAAQDKDPHKLSLLYKVFVRLGVIVGLLGIVVCAAGAPLLSRFAFSNPDYTWSFVFVSVSLLLMSLSNTSVVWMQATRHLKSLAKSSLLGAALSLGIAIPIFYFLREDGIVPSIVGGYLALFLVNGYFARKIKTVPVPAPTVSQVTKLGTPIVKLGVVLMLSNSILTFLVFLLNSFIRRYGSIDDVGFYQAALSICVQGMVVVNATLAADYFPRLSAVHQDQEKVRQMSSQQAELITFIMGPFSVLLIIFAPFVVTLLLAEEFRVIIPMLRWMSLALLFRGLWNVLGFIILAKGDKKTFLYYDAIIGHGMNFVLNCIGYYFWGLNGLAITYLVGSILMCAVLIVVIRVKYDIHLTGGYFKIMGLYAAISAAAMLTVWFLSGFYYYACIVALVAFSLIFTLRQLDRRMGLAALIRSRFKNTPL